MSIFHIAYEGKVKFHTHIVVGSKVSIEVNVIGVGGSI
jgi:hypothetical protein